MFVIRIFALLFAAVFLLTACRKDEPVVIGDDPVPPAGDEAPVNLETYRFAADDFPRMDGSPGTAPLAQAVAAVMLGQSRDDTEHSAVFTQTSRSFRNLASGSCDILFAGEPSAAVINEISRQDFRYSMAPIAVDALVFIVSLSNPVDNLTSEQVRAIYSGDITSWQQAGGSDLDIAAYQRSEEALSQVLMEKLVMNGSKMADAPMQTILSDYFMYSDDAALTAIRGFDGSVNAIGYTMYYYAADMGMADGYKILSVDGIMPARDTIESGLYPFVNPYYAVINRDLPEDDGTRILYNWLLSETGQDFISAQGYVSMKDYAAQSGSEPFVPAQLRWDVVTDDSKLMPYSSPRSRFTRLYNTALPSFEQYDGYGLLLPYSTAVTMNDGSIYPVKYGFAAVQSGIVVTDPVYDNITRAVYTDQSGNHRQNAYCLHMNLPGDDPDYGYRTMQTACAADGSWITPHIYDNIVFRKDIFFCQNDYFGGTFDIDVYDYNGRLLYNIAGLDWAERISENVWPEYLMYGENDNCAFIQLDDGIIALMDMLTGEIRETDFANAYMFSDGLACVTAGGSNSLWGFVDSSFEFVIPPAYAYEAAFIDGRAIVSTPDGAQHVINNLGDVLFTAPMGYILGSLDIYTGYAAYSTRSAEYSPPIFYTRAFDEIAYPPEVLPLGPESSASFLRQGWVLCMAESGSYIFNTERSYKLPEFAQQVNDFFFYDFDGQHSNGYVIFTQYDSVSGQQLSGVISLNGDVIIPPAAGQSISFVFMAESPPWFAVNATPGSGISGFADDSYAQTGYKLVDPVGQTIMSGIGILSYDAATGFLQVQGSDYFALLGSDFTAGSGNVLFAIPSMAYSLD